MSKVFIGMPVYNGERYLKEALGSLLAQSFTDFKILISDDCSTDGTREICEKIASVDSRVFYIKQEKNLGMDANFSYLLKQCDAPYFMWAAQDDIWRKDFLKTCVGILDSNKNVGVAFTGLINTDSYGRLIREYPEFSKFSGEATISTVIHHLSSPEVMGRGNLMYALIRSDLARKINALYASKVAWGGDVIYAFGLVAHGGVKIDPIVLYEKRHGGFSNPDSTKTDDPNKATMLVYDNYKNFMFPIHRFKAFLKGHLDVATGTPYKNVIRIILYWRSLRALWIYIKSRNYKKLVNIR